METLETLGKRIATTEDLQSIVTTMKSLSAVSIRQYEQAVEALRDYSRTIELGLQAVLRSSAVAAEERRPADGRTLAVVFGSDHGLCGRFNREIVRHARENVAERQATTIGVHYLAAGARAADLLAAADETVLEQYLLPGSVAGLTETAYAILRTIDDRRQEETIARVLVYHNRRTARAPAEPHGLQLLPLDPAWLGELATKPWPSPALPLFTLPPTDLYRALVRQQLFIGLFRAGAESAASEHAARLSAMQAAERNIEERMEEMNAAYRRKRQESITEELLDVVAGFEAMSTGRR
jgi:F-type H+-transporting ATPase subunit gamma